MEKTCSVLDLRDGSCNKFPIFGRGKKSTVPSHISKSGNSTKEALDREMGRKSHEISVIVVKV